MPKPKPALAGLPMEPSGEDATRLLSSWLAPASSGRQLQSREALFAATDLALAASVAALAGAIYFPVIDGLVRHMGDYEIHASFTRLFVETGALRSPACLLHLLTAGLVLTGLSSSYESATLAVVVASHAATAAALYLCARWALGGSTGLVGRIVLVVIAALGPFVQPPVPRNSVYTIGYLWTEPYHSPTYALLKPLALAAATFAVFFLSGRGRPDRKVLTVCAAVVAAGTLAKPSYAICALPALVLCSLYFLARNKPFSRIGVMAGWCLPACFVLAWQYLRTYILTDQSRYADAIVFAPLAVMKSHASDLAAPYVWSVLLPLCVVAIYGRRALSDSALRFSLTAFLFGTAYTYGLAERHHLEAGNFLWSSYITLFIVYFFSIVFVIRELIHAPGAVKAWMRAAPCLAVVAWQLTSGISVHMTYMRLFP